MHVCLRNCLNKKKYQKLIIKELFCLKNKIWLNQTKIDVRNCLNKISKVDN